MSDESISDKKLDFGYWYVTHRLQLKKTLTAAILTLDAILWGYVLLTSVLLLVNYRSDKAAWAELSRGAVAYQAYQEENTVIPPEASGQYAMALGGQKYDLAAQVENPNAQWAIPYLEYRFVWTGGQTDFQSGFLLPGEKKFLLALNVPGDAPPSDASIEFQNVRYLRMTARRNLPPGSESGFAVKDISFVPAGAQPLLGGKVSSASTVTFSATNNMPYNFWSVNFKAILYQGGNVVGVNNIPSAQFKSGETRQLEMNWFQNLSQITGVSIEPEVNLLDQSAFMPME